LAVAHKEFLDLGEKGIKAFGLQNSVVFDVKGLLPLGAADGRL
jgi:UDP-N-acetyl-D-galactosamine dehydrogenase